MLITRRLAVPRARRFRSAAPALAAILAVLVMSVDARQAKPTFEVASIRPAPAEFAVEDLATVGARLLPGGVFRARHVSVQTLLMFAYDVKAFQITGGPGWVTSERFNIDARAASDASRAQMQQMVIALLESRFKLVTGKEQRDMRFTALVLAREDGRLGPYLRRLPDDCTRETAAEVRKQFPARTRVEGAGGMSGLCDPLTPIADLLSLRAGQPVVDRTGLTGRFVWDVRYYNAPTSRAEAADLAPVADAIEDQLGLKLVASRGLVDVVVIESVEKPSEN